MLNIKWSTTMKLNNVPDAKAAPMSFVRKGSHDRIIPATLGNTKIIFLTQAGKNCPRHRTSKKGCPCILKASWVHKAHIECTSTSRPKIQYKFVQFHLVKKQMIWILVREDPKLLDDGGEILRYQGRGWRFDSRL